MKISVIIPTFNEERKIAQAIDNAWAFGVDEVIVVDGGSHDATVQLAEQANCRLLQTDLGRGVQLNAGAEIASGSVLVFLHADNWLHNSAGDQVRQAIRSGASCGAFKQRIESSRAVFRFIEMGNEWRVRWLQLAYGDQGIFVTREVYDSLGGFDRIPVMEDFCFSMKLKQKFEYRLLDGPIFVDSRRWDKRGAVKQTFSNWLTVWRFMGGVDPVNLKYDRVSE